MAEGKPIKKVTRPRRVTDEQIAAAIEKHHGVLSSAAKQLKISRQALWKRINDAPDLKQAVNVSREAMVDLAESKLYAAIAKGAPWAIRLVLITLGKDRGFTRTVNLTGNLETTGVVHVLKLPDNGRDSRNSTQ